ncbi:MAG: hypothetical protein KKH98_05595 [Spirochaetes bacterium]|nr:hypothetical protein [Spirochaetota bacterium]
MKKLKYFILFVWIIGGLIFLITDSTTAMNIIPMRVYEKVKLNKKVTGEYLVGNSQKVPVQITIRKSDQADWFNLKEQKFILEPGMTKKIPYSILLKDKKKKGEYRSGTFINQIPASKKKGLATGASLQTRITLPVYIFIEGTEVIDYKVKKFDLKGSFQRDKKLLKGQIKVDLNFLNSGNIHFFSESKLSVYKLDNNQKNFVGEQAVEKAVVVFPEKDKDISLTYNGSLEPGIYLARIFTYFSFDEAIKIDNDDLLKKEKVFKREIEFTIEKDGKFSIIKQE